MIIYYLHKNNEFDYLSVLFKNLYYLLVILLFFMGHNFFFFFKRGANLFLLKAKLLKLLIFFFFIKYIQLTKNYWGTAPTWPLYIAQFLKSVTTTHLKKPTSKLKHLQKPQHSSLVQTDKKKTTNRYNSLLWWVPHDIKEFHFSSFSFQNLHLLTV